MFLDDVGARGLDGTLVVLFCVTPRLLVDDPALGLFGTGNLEGERPAAGLLPALDGELVLTSIERSCVGVRIALFPRLSPGPGLGS